MKKELYVIGQMGGVIRDEDFAKLQKHFEVSFLKKNEIKKITQTEVSKVVVIDPDYIDWKFPNEIWKDVKNLAGVCLATTTDSYVDALTLKQMQVPVLTVGKYSTDSVAEYLFMLMLCAAKKVPLQLKNDNRQEFSDEFLQYEIKGKKVGIVGLGNIGTRLAQMCQGFGMQVAFWNRSKKDVPYKKCSLEKIFSSSDIVFVTLANTPQTRLLITDEMLLSMKSTSILLSAVGFELVNEKLIRQMLKERKIYGFGAEVPNAKLSSIDGNAMITSEYAWFTCEACERRLDILLKNILSLK